MWFNITQKSEIKIWDFILFAEDNSQATIWLKKTLARVVVNQNNNRKVVSMINTEGL